MLSILIPVYNFDVTLLVHELVRQAEESEVKYEVICFDDGSEESFRETHRDLSILKGLRYEEMPENLGRSAIRNALAAAAQYPYLLFMDGDSKVVRANYIARYIADLEPNTLIYGGRVYADQAPQNPKFLFHWNYGRQREQVDAEKRQTKPYHAFQTNNFLIPKTVFDEIRFDESLKQYGHEDTLFGFELRQRQIPIRHIDNPLEHIGLEQTEVFLRKTEKGIENLLRLERKYPFIETRLLRTYRRVKAGGLSGVVRRFFKLLKPSILERLKQGEQNMRWFDIYKLGLLIEKAVKGLD
jgi:glycosyltransferase involved in cell wall biosynthesis